MKRLLLLSVLLLTACAEKETETPNDPPKNVDYEDIVLPKISWFDIFNREEEKYLVYFYSEECGYCNSIKEEILDYYETTTRKMFFIDVVEDGNVVINHSFDSVIGVNDIEHLYIRGTPSLLELENKTVVNYYAGVQTIRAFISNVEDYNFHY